MLELELELDFDEIIDEVDAFASRQLPYASKLALDETVFKTANQLKQTVNYFIKGGAVPFTKRGFRYIKAPSKRQLVAAVYIPDEQWKYMRWVVSGGNKVWMKSRHGISKPIYDNVRFNKYGNIPGRRRKEAIWRTLLNAGGGTKGLGKNEFIGTIGGITGLWKRNNPKPPTLLIIFDHKPVAYESQFPFHKFSKQFAIKFFKKAFNRKLVQVMNAENKRLRASPNYVD